MSKSTWYGSWIGRGPARDGYTSGPRSHHLTHFHPELVDLFLPEFEEFCLIHATIRE